MNLDIRTSKRENTQHKEKQQYNKEINEENDEMKTDSQLKMDIEAATNDESLG